MLPQDGSGAGTPSPRKLRDASERMAEPSSVAAMMMMGAVTLGKMWRHMIRFSPPPMALAAST